MTDSTTEPPSPDPHTRYSTLYVDLDSLFDTRMALLYTDYGPDIVEAILKTNYQRRIQDVFPGVEPVEYFERYGHRTSAILVNAMITPIMDLCVDFVNKTILTLANTPFESVPRIVINLHPYVLSDAESATILSAMVAKTQRRCDVEIISLSLEDLTPTYVKEHFTILVMYRYDLWLNHHIASSTFDRSPCFEITLLGPMLLFKYPMTEADTRKMSGLEITPFQAAEIAVSPYINLKLIEVEHFSIDFKLPS